MNTSTDTFRNDVANHFKNHVGEWINGLDLARIGGAYAWRTRVSECRKQLGMKIQNRLRKNTQHSPDCPGSNTATPGIIDCRSLAGCRCTSFTISEYKYLDNDHVS